MTDDRTLIASEGDIVYDDDGVAAYRVTRDIRTYDVVSHEQFKGLNQYADPVTFERVPDWFADRVEIARYTHRLPLRPPTSDNLKPNTTDLTPEPTPHYGKVD